MYLRFFILSSKLIPINVDLQSERKLIYNAIVNNHLAVATAMHARNMVEFLKKLPRITNRVYRRIDLDNGAVVKVSDTELNDPYQSCLIWRSVDGYGERKKQIRRRESGATNQYRSWRNVVRWGMQSAVVAPISCVVY